MAVGVDAKAVGQHDEFAGLRHQRNRNKTQQQLYWPNSHSTILTHFEARAWNQPNPKWPVHREESDGSWAAGRAVARMPQNASSPVKTTNFATSAERVCGSSFHMIPSTGCATQEAQTAP